MEMKNRQYEPKDDFIRVATASPEVSVAPVVFPKLSLTGRNYTASERQL